jgi:hypothetical protein
MILKIIIHYHSMVFPFMNLIFKKIVLKGGQNEEDKRKIININYNYRSC